MKFPILAILGLVFVGCGVKGPPTPAYSTKPKFDVADLPFVPDADTDSNSAVGQ